MDAAIMNRHKTDNSSQRRRSAMSESNHELSEKELEEIDKKEIKMANFNDHGLELDHRHIFFQYFTHVEIGFLYRSYRAEMWFWEILETGRRLTLTAFMSIADEGKWVE